MTRVPAKFFLYFLLQVLKIANAAYPLVPTVLTTAVTGLPASSTIQTLATDRTSNVWVSSYAYDNTTITATQSVIKTATPDTAVDVALTPPVGAILNGEIPGPLLLSLAARSCNFRCGAVGRRDARLLAVQALAT